MQASRIASLMRAESVIFHPAYYLNDAADEVYNKVTGALKQTINNIRDEGISILLRAETTGKASQFGSLEETLNLCVNVDGVAPCIDFAHLHARTGESNSYGEFIYILNRIATRLGWNALEHLHMHVSGIEYTFKGEISHLNLKDSDLRYVDLLKAIKDLDVKGRIICESPNLEQDALIMQKTFEAL
jgi:deoxyribonuclease-4